MPSLMLILLPQSSIINVRAHFGWLEGVALFKYAQAVQVIIDFLLLLLNTSNFLPLLAQLILHQADQRLSCLMRTTAIERIMDVEEQCPQVPNLDLRYFSIDRQGPD